MKSTKSVRLKKYGSVYDTYIRTNVVLEKREVPKREVSPKRNRSPKADKIKPVKSSKKNLNDYQKFVKEESVKDKYKNIKGSERMVIISKEWEKKKRKRKK